MVLGARITPSELYGQIIPGLIILAVLVLVARSLGVLFSTMGSGLDRPSTLFMIALAPRGTVAAATSSVFALELDAHGVPGADALVSLTFVIIVGAGLLYGLGAGPAGRRIGVIAPAIGHIRRPSAACARFGQHFRLRAAASLDQLYGATLTIGQTTVVHHR